MSYEIILCATRPSEVVDSDNAKDVEVRVEGAGINYTGSVTVVWDKVNKRYAAFGGDPAAWVEGDLLQALQRAYTWDALREVLHAIEAVADTAARAFDTTQSELAADA